MEVQDLLFCEQRTILPPYCLWDVVSFPEVWNYNIIGLTIRIYAYTIIDCTLTELRDSDKLRSLRSLQLLVAALLCGAQSEKDNSRISWIGLSQSNPHTAMLFFTLWVYIPTHLPPSHSFYSHWINLPRTLLKVTSQIVWQIHAMAFKAAWWVMQALEFWADTKSCRDLSHLFRVDLSRLLGEKNLLPSGARTWVCSPAL